MQRIERRNLSATISGAIKRLPKSAITRITSKLPVDRDAAAKAIADAVCDQIDNDSNMVIQADIVNPIGCQGRPGVFGVDEPDPTDFVWPKRIS